MKILQVACGFSYSNVYKKLFSELVQDSVDFEVYVPQHTRESTKLLESSTFSYRLYSNKSIKKYDKILYYTKINRMVKDIDNNFNLSAINLLHAHSLFSDGAVAYRIYQKYNIPYIVTIRNTDVNKYYKYGFHLRTHALNILKNAKNIIFISASYKEYVFEKYIPTLYKSDLLKKTKVLPNGVDEYWLNQKQNIKEISNNKIKLIFVGRIDKNKNLSAVIQTNKLLRERGINSTVDIIGDGPLFETYKKQNKENGNIAFHGSIKNIEDLRNFYSKNDILIVPSFNETFGLVYIEAMSCGLPVIYSKNQGFDGNFKDGEVGYAVDPKNFKQMADSVISIIDNYSDISERCLNLTDQFSWNLISKEYVQLYK